MGWPVSMRLFEAHLLVVDQLWRSLGSSEMLITKCWKLIESAMTDTDTRTNPSSISADFFQFMRIQTTFNQTHKYKKSIWIENKHQGNTFFNSLCANVLRKRFTCRYIHMYVYVYLPLLVGLFSSRSYN